MPTPTTILGIHDGFTASACLLRDGHLVAAVSEERLTRTKNAAGYPHRAIEQVLAIGGCDPRDISAVALATRFMHSPEFFLDWSWYRQDMAEQQRDQQAAGDRAQYFLGERLSQRTRAITDHLGIPPTKVTIVDHHEAHASSAYYASPWINDPGPVLVLTLDGSGDGLCATVSVGENRYLRRVAQTGSSASIGKVYSRITYLLGMKPHEHEYKLMGLAPYADPDGAEKAYQVIRPLVELDDDSLVYRQGTPLSTSYCYAYLRERLENYRFDWIAGGIQRRTEELVVQWARNAIKHTGIGKMACAGGVFMNVKANMLLAALPETDSLFVFPSAGDESLCFGAAYKAHRDLLGDQGGPWPPFPPAYLGPAFSEGDVELALQRSGVSEWCEVAAPRDIDAAVAQLLAQGDIVARCDGRMEWGARALGNRSILMSPDNVRRVRDLNAAIKHRDFWMPFAPTILAERQHLYMENAKSLPAPHMVLAFGTTNEGRGRLAAALHPYDNTIRPQLLEAKHNPAYHNLIRAHERLTGVGAVLNTSFNLHGEPIVCSPADAIDTLRRTGLTNLVLGKRLLQKRVPQ